MHSPKHLEQHATEPTEMHRTSYFEKKKFSGEHVRWIVEGNICTLFHSTCPLVKLTNDFKLRSLKVAIYNCLWRI
jgi:hypothetical protein